ncbi:LOW QUALITY PROTEIN: phosphorylase b kinase gamma catalytic chain, skeletal muscle/heart isoform-like [Amphiura filiformis]|uniref:LOW QUALITY PROTEIN: phosphorylase b kinase gamma catalytic chain, skeletal muscle/heart isoform-like n=1 Tax=Amphiura filiformis TaxID=82378 RepID=UPI003B227838
MTIGSDEPDIDLVAQYGDVFSTKYLSQEMLGRGISSTVRKCTNRKTGIKFAVKIIDLETGLSTDDEAATREEYLNEVAIIKKLSTPPGHPNIIQLHDFIETPTYFFLVFELCTGGELFDHLTEVVTLSERKTRHIMKSILEAVEYIHSNNIAHRDLKPENILLDENLNVKISDFGMARVLQDGELLTELCGTPGYLSPEALKCNMEIDNVAGYSKEVDLWALGVIMFTLLVGCPPFWHRRQVIMLRHIMEGAYTFGPEWDDISDSPKDLISKLLVVDPAVRLTATQALDHRFFETSEQEEEQKKSSPTRRFKTPPEPETPKEPELVVESIKVPGRFPAAVCAIQGIRRLQGLNQRPINIEASIKSPYQHKAIRKVIDSLAFGIHGHWVKKGEGQNRAALFENSQKVEMKQAHLSLINTESNTGLEGLDSSFTLGDLPFSRFKDEGQNLDSPTIKVDCHWY